MKLIYIVSDQKGCGICCKDPNPNMTTTVVAEHKIMPIWFYWEKHLNFVKKKNDQMLTTENL